MSVAWSPTRWWDRCQSEDEKKGIEPIFLTKISIKLVNNKIW